MTNPVSRLLFLPFTLPLISAITLPTVALSAALLQAQNVHVRVSHDVKTGIEGATEFPTIQNALDHHPFAATGFRVIIALEPGIYNERIIVTQNHSNITLLGTGKTPADTVITNSLNAKTAGGTFFTETVEINGSGFQADNITFENAAGNTGQAVAVANRSDRSIFKHCRFLGHQDTLFADFGRQYYVDSYLEGGVDYIFGNAAAVFDRDELHSNGPGYITAQSRTSPNQPTGFVILNSRVTAVSPDLSPQPQPPSGTARHSATPSPEVTAQKPVVAARNTIGLGRPWRPYARTVFINTELSADLNPAGWNNWSNASNEATAFYAESGSTGPGALPSTRVPWSHQLTPVEAKQFLPSTFLRGADNWNPEDEAAKLP